MMLAQFYAELRSPADIAELARTVANEFANRNIAPLDGVEQYARDMAENDELAERYTALFDKVKELVSQTDLADDSDILVAEKYAGVRLALEFAKVCSDRAINLDKFTSMVIYDLLRDYTPGVDEYVRNLDNVELLNKLGLQHDKQLVDVSASRGFSLRKNGLILSADRMVYPHQFIRRRYCDHFTDLPILLRECIGNGLIVKLRLDPLRLPINPRYYSDDALEKIYWHGKPFSLDLLQCPGKKEKEVVTFHSSFNEFDVEHPVSVTVFRSSMMDEKKRQFMIEEYTPVNDPWVSTKRPPGFGTTWCIQKFAHFVYDQLFNIFSHLDGAVRVFSIEEYGNALQDVMEGKNPGSKIGSRHKLFLVEGSISMECIQSLLYEFFRRNPHPAEYFSGA